MKTLVLLKEGRLACEHDFCVNVWPSRCNLCDLEVTAMYECKNCGLTFRVVVGTMYLSLRCLARLLRGDKLLAWRLDRKDT